MKVNRNLALIAFLVAFCLFATLPILLAEPGSCAILTSSEDWRYSMMASGLAAENDCVLVTNPWNALTDRHTKKRLMWLNDITLLGGEDIVSSHIEEQLCCYKNSTCLEGFTKTNIVRVGGRSFYETSALLADQWEAPEGIILVRDDIYADALIAGQLSYISNSPILFTQRNEIPEVVLDKIKEKRLDVTIIGDTNAVSSDVENAVREAGANVNRIAGESQEETATLVAQKYIELAEQKNIKIDSVIFVNWRDRKWYDVSQGTKLLNSVILYTDKSSIPKVSKDFLDSHFEINKAFIAASNEELASKLSDDEQYLKTIEFKSVFPETGILTTLSPAEYVNLIVDKLRTKLERAGKIFAPMKVVGAGGAGGAEGGESP